MATTVAGSRKRAGNASVAATRLGQLLERFLQAGEARRHAGHHRIRVGAGRGGSHRLRGAGRLAIRHRANAVIRLIEDLARVPFLADVPDHQLGRQWVEDTFVELLLDASEEVLALVAIRADLLEVANLRVGDLRQALGRAGIWLLQEVEAEFLNTAAEHVAMAGLAGGDEAQRVSELVVRGRVGPGLE